MGAACAMAMSWSSSGPTIAHVKGANKTIMELKKPSDQFLCILQVKLNEGLWMSISDASLANVRDMKMKRAKEAS